MGHVRRPNYAQRFLLPPSLEDWVGPEHPVRFVHDFVDALDLAELGIKDPQGEVGRPPVAADVLLKVWLYGFTQRVRSTRKLEKACREVMPFMWLTYPDPPDHNTIWRFFRDNRTALPKLFKKLMASAAEAELISFALHALDGTKLQAASSTDTALHRKSLEEKLKLVNEIIAQYMGQVEAAGSAESTDGRQEMPAAMQDAEARRQKIREALQRRVEDREEAQAGASAPEPPAEQGELAAGGPSDAKVAAPEAATEQREEPPVAAAARRTDEAAGEHATEPTVEPTREEPPPSSESTAPQEATEPTVEPTREEPPPSSESTAPEEGSAASCTVEAEKAPLQREAELLKKELEEKLGKLDEAKVNHLSEIEPDARMMKGRGMSALGYNAQIVVDHESDMIVACNVTADQNDVAQLTPMLEQVREQYGRVADQTVTDGGYDSGAQLARAEDQQLPVLARLREDSEAKGDFSKEHFRYDAAENVYVCPRGEKLLQIGTSKPRPTAEPDLIYRCNNKTCPVRAQCSKDPRGRKIRRPPHEEARERQARKQQDPRMAILLGLRKEIVEHLFGIVKTIDGFRRFTVRGLEKVNAQWALVCMGVNLRKLFALATWRGGKLVPRAAGPAAAVAAAT
jgi:transposase